MHSDNVIGFHRIVFAINHTVFTNTMKDDKFTLAQATQIDSRLVLLPTEIHFDILRRLLLFTDVYVTKKLQKRAIEDQAARKYEKSPEWWGFTRWRASNTCQKEFRPIQRGLRVERENINRETTTRVRDGLNLSAACQVLYEVGSHVFYHENNLEISMKAKRLSDVRFTALMSNLRWFSLKRLHFMDPGAVTIESGFKVHTPAEARKYPPHVLRDLPVDARKYLVH